MKKTLLLLLSIFVLFSCKSTRKSSQPTLTVSITPLHFVVEAIVGDKYQIETLMPQGVSPETYDPTPRQMVELSNSEAIFCIGTLNFEQVKMPQIVSSIPHLTLVNCSENITPLADKHHHHDEETESIDPHIWMSPQNLKIMAQNVCRYMCYTHPNDTNYYQQRLKVFEKRMDDLDASLRNTLHTLPSRTFLIYHPALGYFAHHYGLKQLTVEHDGKDPSAAYFQQLINLCRAEEVHKVFISKEHNGKAAQRIANELNIPTITINPLDQNIDQQLMMIAKSLKQ